MIDLAVQVLKYPCPVTHLLPRIILANDAEKTEGYPAEILSPEAIDKIRREGLPLEEGLDRLAPGFRGRFAPDFPAHLVRRADTQFKYVPTGVVAPDMALEEFRGFVSKGRTAMQMYDQSIRPRLLKANAPFTPSPVAERRTIMRGFLRLASFLGVLLIVQVVAAADEDGFKPIFNGKKLDGLGRRPQAVARRGRRHYRRDHRGEPCPRQHVSHLAWRQAGQLRVEGRVPHAQSRALPTRASRFAVGKARKSGASAATSPTWMRRTSTRASVTARASAASWPSAARRSMIGADHKPKVVEQFGDSKELAKVIKKRDWNEYDIIAQGNHIIQKINGQLMCEVTDEDTVARKDGVIALQIHAGPPMKVQFRNIRLKELP